MTEQRSRLGVLAPRLGKAPGPDTLRAKSDRQTGRLAKSLGAEIQVNSGAGRYPGRKGDLILDDTLIEAKRTKAEDFTLRGHVIAKAHREAAAVGKYWALALTMEGLPSGVEKDLMVIPLGLWKLLREDR